MGVKTIITCDICGDSMEYDGPYHTIKEEMKEDGFRNVKNGDKWEIKCGKCRGKG